MGIHWIRGLWWGLSEGLEREREREMKREMEMEGVGEGRGGRWEVRIKGRRDAGLWGGLGGVVGDQFDVAGGMRLRRRKYDKEGEVVLLYRNMDPYL